VNGEDKGRTNSLREAANLCNSAFGARHIGKETDPCAPQKGINAAGNQGHNQEGNPMFTNEKSTGRRVATLVLVVSCGWAAGAYGFAGDTSIVGFSGYVLNSYAACEMLALAAGKDAAVAGGLFGKATVSATSAPVAIACLWDAEASGVPGGSGSGTANSGTGLSTKQMQQQSTFEQAGWDFSHTWARAKDDYPVLQWEVAQDGGRASQN
jgi:hypothetical protein